MEFARNSIICIDEPLFERMAKYSGDELDLLVIYMDQLFDLGPTETNGTRIMGYAAGQVFDHHFLELEQWGSIPHRHY